MLSYTDKTTINFYEYQLAKLPSLTSNVSVTNSWGYSIDSYSELFKVNSFNFHLDLIINRYKLSPNIHYVYWDGYIDELNSEDKTLLYKQVNEINTNTRTSLKYLKELK